MILLLLCFIQSTQVWVGAKYLHTMVCKCLNYFFTKQWVYFSEITKETQTIMTTPVLIIIVLINCFRDVT